MAWTRPPLNDILDKALDVPMDEELKTKKQTIEQTLAYFEITAPVKHALAGPRFSRFELQPTPSLDYNKVKRLETDLALALAGALMEIEAPGPGSSRIALIVQNETVRPVSLREVLLSPQYKESDAAIKLGLGIDTRVQPALIDLAELPHLLIGGTTLSGKSVGINALVAQLLCTYTPDQLKLLLVDPLQIELQQYDGVPHLLEGVVSRMSRIINALDGVANEVERRYRVFADIRARDLPSYNEKANEPLPYIVVVVDNLHDLMMDAPEAVEKAIEKMAQKARGAGVHLILSTLRTRVETIAGRIKANFPGRIAFRVPDSSESKLIIDKGGAEELLGPGDMLYKAPQTNHLQRIQGIYPSEAELRRLIDFWRGG